MTSNADDRGAVPDRTAWPVKPTHARAPVPTPDAAPPGPADGDFDHPTDAMHPVAPATRQPAPAHLPPPSPWSPPPAGAPPTPPPPPAGAPPTPPPPPMMSPSTVDPVPSTAGPRRGLLLLAAGTVVALLVGTFVVVVVARSGGHGTVTAANTAASPQPSTTPGAEQPVPADSASTDSSPSPSSRPKSPTPAAPRSARDDFTAAAIDKTKWAVYGTNGQGAYEASMVRVSGGELQVFGVGNSPTAAANFSGGLCWCVDGNHVYGSWQARARFDAGSGYRQVLELWPQSDSATADGSINFASDGDAAKKVLGLVLLPPAGGGAAVHTSRNGDFTAWHVYRVDWRPTYVRMYVDEALAYDSSTSTTPLTIPHSPMHLVIQQDKGPGNGIPAADGQTPAQVVMHVDWVRFDP